MVQNRVFRRIVELHRIDLFWPVVSIPGDRLVECFMSRKRLAISEIAPDFRRIHIQVLFEIQLARKAGRRAWSIADHYLSAPAGDSREFFNPAFHIQRSEEHTSELQSLRHLVCRLLLEKK